MSRSSSAKRVEPIRITDAPVSPGADVAARQKRYLISMGIRTVCFVGAVAVGDGWLRWVLVAGALVLPYIAVVMANSASPQVLQPRVEGPGHHALGAGEGRRADGSLHEL